MKMIVQALLFLLPTALLAQVTLVASVSKNPVEMGESFELKFTAINSTASITPPNLDGFKILSGPNKASSTTFKDGKSKSESSVSYTLLGKQEGRASIGAARLVEGGETHLSNEINVLIVEGGGEAEELIEIVEIQADEVEDDKIVFNDGESMPGRKLFVKDCVAELESSHDEGDPVLNNKNVCNCMLDAIAKQYTMSEFVKLSAKKGNGLLSAMNDKKSPLYNEAIKCVLKNMESAEEEEEDVKPSSNKSKGSGSSIFNNDNPEVKSAFIKSCEEAARKTKEFKSVNIDLNVYCTCTWDKIIELELSLSDLEELSDPNSVVFNNVVTPCLNRAMGGDDAVAKPSSEIADDEKGTDIVGGNETERIELFRQMGVYKVKVTAGGVEKFFILDSGAGDMFITGDYERDLLMEGLIKKKDYKSSRTYMMANGKQVECRRVVLNGIQVGGYTVNNITAAISEEKNAMLLLGKSFLDKFSNWSIDNSAGELVLTK